MAAFVLLFIISVILIVGWLGNLFANFVYRTIDKRKAKS